MAIDRILSLDGFHLASIRVVALVQGLNVDNVALLIPEVGYQFFQVPGHT